MKLKTPLHVSKRFRYKFPVSVILNLKCYIKNQVKLSDMSYTLEEIKKLEFPTLCITAFCYTLNLEIMTKNICNK